MSSSYTGMLRVEAERMCCSCRVSDMMAGESITLPCTERPGMADCCINEGEPDVPRHELPAAVSLTTAAAAARCGPSHSAGPAGW